MRILFIPARKQVHSGMVYCLLEQRADSKLLKNHPLTYFAILY
jgi:hypothetical protein